MSPAGHWPQLHAAIEAGADSVYFGLKHFTARAKAGFSLAELPEAMRTLHRRGVKGFITFNTLVFEHELQEAARVLAVIAEAGADALIIQDLGIVKLAKQIAPDLELHASTQMSITSAEGVALAQRLGVHRVTLARELSLNEIRAIRSQTTCELEIFVHGALCVAYSGQCFSSEAWGGRSANRGQCAQACRLPYEMVVDGEPMPLGDARYLLSPGDLYTIEQIPEIVRIGVAALKIEGRYKDAEYVALTTRAYRQALDDAMAEVPHDRADERLQLEQVYSRGLGPYFMSGTDHQAVVRGRAPRHRGVLMGSVAGVGNGGVVIAPEGGASLKAGDGIVFDAADWRSPQEPEEGGRVYEAIANGKKLELRFANGAVDFSRIRPGDLVWRTHDPDLERAARPFTEASAPVRRQPVHVRVVAEDGAPLRSTWTLVNRPGLSVTVESDAPLARATIHAPDEALFRAQFGRLGNTLYELACVECEIRGLPFVPASLLNQLRRTAVERLGALQEAGTTVAIADPVTALEALMPAEPSTVEAGAPVLHLLVRTPEQLEAALTLAPASITLDYLDLYGLRPSVDRVKAAGIAVRVASPRVLKPGEERIVDFLLRLDCPVLVRAAGLVYAFERREHDVLTGDFSLNAANSLTSAALLDLGLARLTPGHDLNAAQVADLARSAGPDRIEVIAYQHLPVFHTEHCVFCRFLSTGHSYKDCGRPCESHRVSLGDTSGRQHPVMADVGCRNTVFGAEAQDASAHLDAWLAAGIRHFRLEFVHESAGEVARVTKAWEKALRGEFNGRELGQQLKRIAPQGVTEGSLYVPKDYQLLPILQ